MKKILSVLLVLSLMIPFSFLVSAKTAAPLQFDENGSFKILHICDCQDTYPANKTMLTFIAQTLRNYRPDLVILGGDNTVGGKETKEQAVEELCRVFVENETKFTLVFGNHDHQQGVDKEELLKMYQKYGGAYCLAYDADPDLFGVGTHNLPILSSDGTKTAYNLWMFDSNTYVSENPEWDGGEGDYDCVHADQIEWYKETAQALALQNDGKPVPAMAFQHIIVSEVYDALFGEIADVADSSAVAKFNGKTYGFVIRCDRITDGGFVGEFCCPGDSNYGQFDAMVETGDVVAIFSGHDHTNYFTVPWKGIDIVNTPGATFHSYAKDYSRGARLITLREEDTSSYESRLLTIADAVFEDGGDDIVACGDISRFSARFSIFFRKFLAILTKMLASMQKVVYWD